MDLLLGILGPIVLGLAAPLLIRPWRSRRAGRLLRRALAGRAVVLPAQLALHGRHLPPRGALVRHGDDLLWLSRRLFGRSVRLDPEAVGEQGRLVDRTSSAVEWVYRDYPVLAGSGGELRVADWYGDVLQAMRGNIACAPSRVLVAAAIPRWVLLLPVAVVLGFTPLLLAWTNGEEGTAAVVGHDTEYEMCDVTWRTASGRGSATVDCDLEPVGSSIPVRALGFPMSGEAADLLWTLETVSWCIELPLLVSALFLAVHLPIVLRLPAIEPVDAAPRSSADRRRDALGPWQARALERAALDGLRPRRRRRPRARWRRSVDRLLEACDVVRAATGWAAWCAAFGLVFGAIFLFFSLPSLWALARQPTTTVTVRVVETGDRALPFMVRESPVETDQGEELWLTSWQGFEDGERVRVVRSGPVLAVPGDHGLEIEAAKGVVALLAGLGFSYVTWRRARAVLALLPGRTGGPADEEVAFAGFTLPDGQSLLVLLDRVGDIDLAIPVRGRVAPVGVASVPGSRQEGELVVPVVGDRALTPLGPAQGLTGADLDELLDGIA